MHEGGPALILLAHLSLAYGYQRAEAMASRREAKAVEPMAEPAIFQDINRLDSRDIIIISIVYMYK